MLKSSLGPEHYLSDEIYARECEKIFGRVWLFAGFTDFLKEERQYLTRTFGNVPIVITRAGDELVAFENLCPHRQMPLFIDDFGKKGLFCPYHGWAFADDGALRRIPNPEIYQFGQKECSGLHLKKLALRVVGRFVFVNLTAAPIDFEQQFDREFISSLEDVSDYLGDQIGHSRFEAKYNWKLNFENVKDWNHVAYLHATSFAPLLEKARESTEHQNGTLENAEWAHDYQDDATLRELSYHQSSPMIRNVPWYDGALERYRGEDRYYNWFMYPNINFTSIHGELFQLQQYNPISPSATEYNLFVMTARKKVAGQNLVPLVAALLQIEKATIEEDRIYLEKMQKSLHLGAPCAKHGHYEQHIKRMNDWYRRAIDGSGFPK